MSIKSKLERLKAMASEEQEAGASRLEQAGVTGGDDGTIQTVMEHIPTSPGGGSGALAKFCEYTGFPAINDVKITGQEAV